MADEPNFERSQHLCTCVIAINDGMTTVFFDETKALPWPEIMLLQSLHGDENVYNIRPVAVGPRLTPFNEKQRLVSIYGREEVEKVFAGRAVAMEFFAPGWPRNPEENSDKREPDNYRPPKSKFSKAARASLDASAADANAI